MGREVLIEVLNDMFGSFVLTGVIHVHDMVIFVLLLENGVYVTLVKLLFGIVKGWD